MSQESDIYLHLEPLESMSQSVAWGIYKLVTNPHNNMLSDVMARHRLGEYILEHITGRAIYDRANTLMVTIVVTVKDDYIQVVHAIPGRKTTLHLKRGIS